MQLVKNTPAFWNAVARKYAADPIADIDGYENTLRRTLDLVGEQAKVLELGCGTGMTALRLAPHLAQIEASDFSPEMIAIAQEKAKAEGILNAHFNVAQPGPLPHSDGTFDAVLAFNLLHLVEDREAMLKEIIRVLKPGGLFISKTACLSEMNPLFRVAIPLAQIFRKAPYVDFFVAARIEAEIEAAGLPVIERARHGTRKNDPKIFLVARKPE